MQKLVEVSSPNKHITSLRLLKSKSYVVANMVVKKEVKFVEQDVGEENIGGSIDQDDIGDATIDEEFEELEEHD